MEDSFSLKQLLIKERKIILFLLLISFLVYLNSLNNAPVSDDVPLFKVLDRQSFFSSFFGAITHFSLLNSLFSLLYSIFGNNMVPYHLVKILIHFLNTILVYFFTLTIVELTVFNKDAIFRNIIPRSIHIAFYTAALFAVLPIHTEAITWISGGGYSLYPFFILLSLWCFLLFATSHDNYSQIKLYILSVFSFLFSILSSIIYSGTLPFLLVILITSFLLGDRQEGLKQKQVSKTVWYKDPIWKFTLPFWILEIVFVVFLMSQGKVGERTSFVSQESGGESAFTNPFVQIPVAFLTYLKLFLWPKNLSLYHEFFSLSREVYFFYLVFTILVFLSIFFWYKKSRLVFFAITFFFVSLLPTLTPLRVSWVVAERYVYLGSFGFVLIMALMLEKSRLWLLARFKSTNRLLQPMTYFLFIIILAAYGARTIIRNFDWKNEDTLWLATVKASPYSSKAHNNMGDYWGRQGNIEKSIEAFETAISLNPKYADAHHNLGNAYLSKGDLKKAEEQFQKALSFKPHLIESYNNLGLIYFKQNKLDQAQKQFEQILKVNPNSISAHHNLAIIYFKKKMFKEAKKEWATVLSLDPSNMAAQEGLSLIEKQGMGR